MIKYLGIIIFLIILTCRNVMAIYDPQSVANNKIGVHIFSPDEIDKVADLVNSNGGAWGYVTIPLRSDDLDRPKWQLFMKECREHQIIPIIRLATTMSQSGWTKPGEYDYIDFANFLNNLNWPTKNRYVVVYNEPNHATEWEGQINPNEYAHELNRTTEFFKDRSQDFFMLPAGLDVSAPNDSLHMNWRWFIQAMWTAKPESLSTLDGWNSHSYPNPAFAGLPTDKSETSLISYQYELNYVKSFTGKDLPVFITETGWSNETISNQNIADYFKLAFSQVWTDKNIIAITPFVLQAGTPPFDQFSFLDNSGNPKPQHQTLKWLTKIKGNPKLMVRYPNKNLTKVLGETTPLPDFNTQVEETLNNILNNLLKWVRKQ